MKIHYFKAFLKDFPRIILYWLFTSTYFIGYFIASVAIKLLEYTKWIGWLGAAIYPLNFLINLILPDNFTGSWDYRYHLVKSVMFLFYALLVPVLCNLSFKFVDCVFNFIPIIDRFKHRNIVLEKYSNQSLVVDDVVDEKGEYPG